MKQKKNKNKNNSGKSRKLINSLMLILAFVVTIGLLLTNGAVVSTAPIKVGSVSTKKYVAEITIENTVATEKLRQQAADSVGPLYEHDESVNENAMTKIDDYFVLVDEALEEINYEIEQIKLAAMEAAADAAEEGDEDAEAEKDDKETAEAMEDMFELTIKDELSFYKVDTTLNIPVVLTAEQYKAYNDLSKDGKEVFIADIKASAATAFKQGITSETISEAYQLSDDYAETLAWNDELKDMTKAIARAVISPNLVLDEEAIEAAKQKRMAEVEPVMILKDQKIVDEGEIITSEAYEILEALGYTETKLSGNIVLFAVKAVIVLITFVALYLYIVTTQHKMLERGNSLLVLFFVYLLQALVLGVTANFEQYYMVPVSLFAMLAAMLNKEKTAVSLNIFVCIIATVVFGGTVDFLLYALITGTFSAILMKYTKKRSSVFVVSVSVAFINAAAYIVSQAFMIKGINAEMIHQALMAGVMGAMLVVVSVGSLPIWENVFGINTKFRMAELTNPNNELMRRLMIETPGTYHHSLIVANLAETAAYDIYADEALARAGAYYHDIGKLSNSRYFSENQMGTNPHDQLDPYISAKTIISHVENGLDLAKQYRLPEVIKDIIVQHHGTTLVKYFYMKSAKEKSGDCTHESDFRYPGPIPQSKEAAIVMLADTVEAAVRSSAAGKTMEEMEGLIDNLIKDKLNDGQLNDCRLDLKELEIIKKSFMKMFKGMYHERIAYPKAEEIAAARQAEKEREEETAK